MDEHEIILPPASPPPSKLRFLWPILIVFLMLSVVGIGAYIIDAGNRQPLLVDSLLTPTPDMPDPTPTPIPDPTRTWKTYTDPVFAYSFKYPEQLTVTTENEVLQLVTEEDVALITIAVSNEKNDFRNKAEYVSCQIAFQDNGTEDFDNCVEENEYKLMGAKAVTSFSYREIGARGGLFDIIQTRDVPALQFTVSYATDVSGISGDDIFRQVLPTFTFLPASASAGMQ